MKHILLFGAGKSATSLIDFLIQQTAALGWRITVADSNMQLVQSKIRNAPNAQAIAVSVEDEEARRAIIQDADIIISMLPASLHILVAKDCVLFNKNLLTASYVDPSIRAMESEIKKKGLLFLCEMGLDPGIDHMSAMQLIHRIQSEGHTITSFRSHTGGLVAPDSDDNPWHYKISWNPRNVVMAGSAGAVYLDHDEIVEVEYPHLFENCKNVELSGLGALAWYPNRDSLGYIPIYGLEQASTFIRTTLRYPIFCKGWSHLVTAGLTDDQKIVNDPGMSIKQWAMPLLPFVNDENLELYDSLGLFDDRLLPVSGVSSAIILQSILEDKWKMKPDEKDMIVMLHEIEHTTSGADQKLFKTDSWLIVKGDDNTRTAMAKTVGLPLGIAAILILQQKLNLTGLHIPVLPAIYEPVLQELEHQGIRFEEKTS